jgi:hypothetical protein
VFKGHFVFLLHLDGKRTVVLYKEQIR